MPKPLLCNPKPFKDQFRRDTRERRERRYCFVLGAGASVASGIPSGKALADQWLKELYERQCPAPAPGAKQPTIEEWCADPDCPVTGVDPKNPGTHYPQLFLARFPGTDPEGQRFIQEAIRGANTERPNVPSVGYAYLALILQNTDSRVVITTNFDNLAADSLLLLTGSLPRVVGHERVAAFAGLRDGQPLIAKIHGDVGFVTANDPDGVSRLHTDWRTPLREIFRDHIPVFIGYDGNDGSLMDFFCDQLLDGDDRSLRRSLLRSGLYWCYRAGEGRDWKARTIDNPRLRRLTEVHQVHFVPIGDFDLWLMELGIACGVGDPENILQENVGRRLKTLAEQIAKARSDQSAPATTPEVEASRAEVREEIGSKLREWDFVYRARAEKDPDKADSLYQEALSIAPDDPGVLGSYANFLTDDRKAHDRAQELYERAIKADPNYSTNLGNYAAFLKEIRKDYDRAQDLYNRAIKANPLDANHLGNYANLLTDIRQEHDRAQDLYERAIKADPHNVDHLSNYATFLTDIRKDYERAQGLYERAIKADPNIANNLGNYARLLFGLGRKTEGLKMLGQALAILRPDSAKDVQAELWFYAFAQSPANERANALHRLKQLIVSDGARSPGWDLSMVVDQASKDGHPDAAWLPKLAAVISTGADLSVLDGWDTWARA